MRILAVTPFYAPEGGGLEQYAHQILQRLSGRGHEVEAITFTRTGLASGPQSGVLVDRHEPQFLLGNAPLALSFADRVRDSLRRFAPDVVVAHTPVPFAAEAAARALRGTRTPLVVTYHAGLLSGSSMPLAVLASIHRATFERRMLSAAAGLIAVSPFVRDHALRRERARVSVIPPGVDTAGFHAEGPPPGRGILFVGPLSKSYAWKGVDVLVRAFLDLRRRMPDATLTLAGTGDRLPEFERLAARLGGALRITGRLGPEALVAAYHAAAVVALPSTTRAESFGMVLAEANSCARPVVASRVGGIPDFVHHGENGLLARPGDAQDLAEQLACALGDPDAARRMGEAGRRRVTREHDWDLLALRTYGALEDAIRRNGK